MNPLKYIYFNIYCWYHVDGKKPRYSNANIAADVAVIAMVGGLGGWIMLSDVIITFILIHKVDMSLSVLSILFILIILFIIFRLLFVSNNKHKTIYNEYKIYDMHYKTLGRILSVGLFVIFPIIMFLLLAVILPRH